ncbi:4-oxalomesaconate tautomerase [Salinisphaera sp. LB1]|uniref:4-oxalomesaconate tautomerase n=1 Tax=Salinisphaera sp. LB1 TaxID=2183911 RepID=UPI000D706E7F|nr:4-oxalomesaconate tautomerase [Salinisphaera sp. LB1]AWN14273.1 FldA protein [Salinisphaera sp. LB1]
MTRQRAIPCSVMRGGTSKGLYFLADDLPANAAERDRILLAAMGSPDAREIDGMGGGHPLTSKVAVVRSSERDEADVEYLFLQVVPDQPIVSDQQNCGNILAGVAPFAIEQGLVEAADGETTVRVYMVNSDSLAEVIVQTPGGDVTYTGEAEIDGVPGSHAPIRQFFVDTAGANCGALLPTGNAVDEIDGVNCTLIDNGMPVVVMAAEALGLAGDESAEDFDESALRARCERIRLEAGRRMNLGDVSEATVPKLTFVSAPKSGGMIATRTLIPHTLHSSIGVLGAVSVASACLLPGTPAHHWASIPPGARKACSLEHPTGALMVEAEVTETDQGVELGRMGILRTARLLMTGSVHVPAL